MKKLSYSKDLPSAPRMPWAQHTTLHSVTIPVIKDVLQDFLWSRDSSWLLTVCCSEMARAHWLLSLLPSRSCTSHCLLRWHCRGHCCSRRYSCCPRRSPDRVIGMMSHNPCWWCWRALQPLEGKRDRYYKDSMQSQTSWNGIMRSYSYIWAHFLKKQQQKKSVSKQLHVLL